MTSQLQVLAMHVVGGNWQSCDSCQGSADQPEKCAGNLLADLTVTEKRATHQGNVIHYTGTERYETLCSTIKPADAVPFFFQYV
jgi:hypothetical protein